MLEALAWLVALLIAPTLFLMLVYGWPLVPAIMLPLCLFGWVMAMGAGWRESGK